MHSSLREIQSALAEVLGGPQFLRSFVVTPYHYESVSNRSDFSLIKYYKHYAF